MITVRVSDLQNRTINSLIDDNQRFTITHEEENPVEEEKTKDVTDKVALLREQYLRESK
jgi:hypothetical protein